MKSQVEIMQVERLFGIHPVLSSLKAQKRKFHRIYFQTKHDKYSHKTDDNFNPLLREIESIANERGIATRFMDKQTLFSFSFNNQNQGGTSFKSHNQVVLEASPLEIPEINSLEEVNSLRRFIRSATFRAFQIASLGCL